MYLPDDWVDAFEGDDDYAKILWAFAFATRDENPDEYIEELNDIPALRLKVRKTICEKTLRTKRGVLLEKGLLETRPGSSTRGRDGVVCRINWGALERFITERFSESGKNAGLRDRVNPAEVPDSNGKSSGFNPAKMPDSYIGSNNGCNDSKYPPPAPSVEIGAGRGGVPTENENPSQNGNPDFVFDRVSGLIANFPMTRLTDVPRTKTAQRLTDAIRSLEAGADREIAIEKLAGMLAEIAAGRNRGLETWGGVIEQMRSFANLLSRQAAFNARAVSGDVGQGSGRGNGTGALERAQTRFPAEREDPALARWRKDQETALDDPTISEHEKALIRLCLGFDAGEAERKPPARSESPDHPFVVSAKAGGGG